MLSLVEHEYFYNVRAWVQAGNLLSCKLGPIAHSLSLSSSRFPDSVENDVKSRHLTTHQVLCKHLCIIEAISEGSVHVTILHCIQDLAQVVISYEIYETSLRRVS